MNEWKQSELQIYESEVLWNARGWLIQMTSTVLWQYHNWIMWMTRQQMIYVNDKLGVVETSNVSIVQVNDKH